MADVPPPPPPPFTAGVFANAASATHLHVPGQRPTRSFTIDDSKLAPELDRQYLTTEESAFASGAFSDVHAGRWHSPDDERYPDGVDVAVKVFRLGGVVADPAYAANNEKIGKRLGREVFVWQRFNHPRITPFVGYIAAFKDGIVPCLVSPRRQGNLLHYITNVNPEADRLQLLIQVLEGLIYLHTFVPGPIVHLDLKPENILITDEGTAELIDFGYSKALDGVSTGFTTGPSPGGSYPYMAPETLMGAEYKDLSPAADVYAMASLILLLLSGKRPWFAAKSKGQLTLNIVRGILPKPSDHPMEGSQEAIDAVWKLMGPCWAIDPDGRPSAQVMLDKLIEVQRLGGIRPVSAQPAIPTEDTYKPT